MRRAAVVSPGNRSRRRLSRASPGFSITEVLIGILLTASIVAAVMICCITARKGIAHSDLNVVAADAAGALSSQLQRYITASYSTTTQPDASIGANGSSASNGWNFPGDYCCDPSSCSSVPTPTGNKTVTQQCTNYALDTSVTHYVTSLLPYYKGVPAWQSPYNMTMYYTVSDYGDASSAPANSRFRVNITVTWYEPPS